MGNQKPFLQLLFKTPQNPTRLREIAKALDAVAALLRQQEVLLKRAEHLRLATLGNYPTYPVNGVDSHVLVAIDRLCGGRLHVPALLASQREGRRSAHPGCGGDQRHSPANTTGTHEQAASNDALIDAIANGAIYETVPRDVLETWGAPDRCQCAYPKTATVLLGQLLPTG